MDFFQNGKSFRCSIIPDDTYGAPWEKTDCYGVVTEWERRDKRPCERILCKDGPYSRFYDVAESIKKALRDGWGVGDSSNENMTKRQIAAHAVDADFKRLRGWCTGEWGYVYLEIFPLTEDGDELKSKAQCIGGVESDDEDYILELAKELAKDC